MSKQWLFPWLRRLRQLSGYRSMRSSGLSTRIVDNMSALHRKYVAYFTTGGAFSIALSWPFSRHEPSLEERIKEQMYNAFQLIKDDHLEEADAELHALLLTLDEATRSGRQTNEEWLSRRARVYSELANLKLLQKDYPAAERLFVHTIRDCMASGVPPGSPMIIELSLKLAMVYSKLEDSEKAESGFAFCLMMQQQNCAAISAYSEDDKPLSEEDLNNLALLGVIQNSYAQLSTRRQPTSLKTYANDCSRQPRQWPHS
uniref:Tetratricopeptide repeat protein 19 n=2 Tax=Schistocephalus solidus TaxID=70667 RepID=A0A0X3PKL1_SCHSO